MWYMFKKRLIYVTKDFIKPKTAQKRAKLRYYHTMLNQALCQHTITQKFLPDIHKFQALIRQIYNHQAVNFLYSTSFKKLGTQEEPNLY